jgi:hypothetical protein
MAGSPNQEATFESNNSNSFKRFCDFSKSPWCPVSEIPSHNHWIVIPFPCLLDSEVEMARGPAVKIILGDSARSELEMRARRRKIARVDAVRAEIVLLAADGMNNCAIAATLGLSRLTAGLWRKRFAKKRFDGLDMALMMSRAAARRARSVTRRSPKS